MTNSTSDVSAPAPETISSKMDDIFRRVGTLNEVVDELEERTKDIRRPMPAKVEGKTEKSFDTPMLENLNNSLIGINRSIGKVRTIIDTLAL